MSKRVNSNRIIGLRAFVCAALILAMTFSFAFADKEQDLKDEIESKNQQSEQVEQAQLLLVTLLEGLQAIERSYPRNVRIFFEERR
jgi:uncharacterized protein YsxB (DUF464 family)